MKGRRRHRDGSTVDGGSLDQGYGAVFTDRQEQQQQQQQGGEEMEAKGRNVPPGNTHTYTHTHVLLYKQHEHRGVDKRY